MRGQKHSIQKGKKMEIKILVFNCIKKLNKIIKIMNYGYLFKKKFL